MSKDKKKKGKREWLPAVLLVDAHGIITPTAGAEGDWHGRPISVSVYEKISDLVREFPTLGEILNHYHRNGEKQLKDLPMPSGEKDRLLNEILTLRKQSQPQKFASSSS